MKKIILILALFSMLLFAGKAEWNVEGYNSDFELIGYRTITFDYSELSIALNELPAKMKLYASVKYNFTYTGNDSTRGESVYHEIEPLIWHGNFSNKVDTIRYVRIGSKVLLNVAE